jgi:O-methyltransferase
MRCETFAFRTGIGTSRGRGVQVDITASRVASKSLRLMSSALRRCRSSLSQVRQRGRRIAGGLRARAVNAGRSKPAPIFVEEDIGRFQENALQYSPLRPRIYADFSRDERVIFSAARSNLCGSPEAIVTLARAVDHVVKHGISGAFVECGVYMGGNIEVMIRALQRHGISDCDIYLYDTFAGMPKPEERDDEAISGAKKSWEAHRTKEDGDRGSNWMKAGVELVRQRLDPLGYPERHLHFVKGMVEDTIPETMPEKIAILRLDTDFYASTKHELQHLYPRLSPGGILIIDDYGAFPGSRQATDEYAAEHGLDWFLHRVDAHVRLVVKPA